MPTPLLQRQLLQCRPPQRQHQRQLQRSPATTAAVGATGVAIVVRLQAVMSSQLLCKPLLRQWHRALHQGGCFRIRGRGRARSSNSTTSHRSYFLDLRPHPEPPCHLCPLSITAINPESPPQHLPPLQPLPSLLLLLPLLLLLLVPLIRTPVGQK